MDKELITIPKELLQILTKEEIQSIRDKIAKNYHIADDSMVRILYGDIHYYLGEHTASRFNYDGFKRACDHLLLIDKDCRSLEIFMPTEIFDEC